MWDRRRFILAFLFVALVALLAYGGIVYAASLIALDEIDRDAALTQWQAFQRALGELAANLQQTAVDYAVQADTLALARGELGASSPAAGRMIERLSAIHGIAAFAIFDDAGDAALVHGLSEAQVGFLATTDAARSAALGIVANGTYVVGDTPFVAAAVPIAAPDGSTPAGALVLARAIGDDVLGDIQALLGRDIMLFREGTLVAGSRSISKKEQQLRESYLSFANPDRIGTRRLPEGGLIATGQLTTRDGVEVGLVQMDIPNSAGPTMRPAITIASLVAILLGLAATYILAQAIGGQLAESAAALGRRERDNARLYAEVQQLNQRLERMISERTTQLRAAVSELQAVQTQLIQADRLAALGTLTASIVHELSTPLTTILGGIHMLLGSEQSEEQREWLEQTRDAALLSQEIMGRVRALARRQRVRREVIDLNRVIGDALSLLRYQLVQSDVDYALELDADLPKIMADETQTQQILFNLINNAREALEGQTLPRQLTIRTERNDNLVRLSILDNGPGLDEAGIPHIFEPFYTTKPPGIGTGLGLYISKGIIESYGGRISGENRQDGPGAVFTVEFPAGLTGGRLSSGPGA